MTFHWCSCGLRPDKFSLGTGRCGVTPPVGGLSKGLVIDQNPWPFGALGFMASDCVGEVQGDTIAGLVGNGGGWGGEKFRPDRNVDGRLVFGEKVEQ